MEKPVGGPALRELWERETMGCPGGYSMEGREGLESWKEEGERVGAGWGLGVTRTWPRALELWPEHYIPPPREIAPKAEVET